MVRITASMQTKSAWSDVQACDMSGCFVRRSSLFVRLFLMCSLAGRVEASDAAVEELVDLEVLLLPSLRVRGADPVSLAEHIRPSRATPPQRKEARLVPEGDNYENHLARRTDNARREREKKRPCSRPRARSLWEGARGNWRRCYRQVGIAFSPCIPRKASEHRPPRPQGQVDPRRRPVYIE